MNLNMVAQKFYYFCNLYSVLTTSIMLLENPVICVNISLGESILVYRSMGAADSILVKTKK